jgi:hypothetical protein
MWHESRVARGRWLSVVKRESTTTYLKELHTLRRYTFQTRLVTLALPQLNTPLGLWLDLWMIFPRVNAAFEAQTITGAFRTVAARIITGLHSLPRVLPPSGLCVQGLGQLPGTHGCYRVLLCRYSMLLPAESRKAGDG